MPTIEWLKQAYSYGYDSGNVESVIPNLIRLRDERRIGGSYRNVFLQGVVPYLKPNSVVVELGPGKGSWSRAILNSLPQGQLHTVDFQDVSKWLKPEKYQGRLICHQVEDNSFECLEDNSFDFFWSFGVLCHNNIGNIKEILKNSLTKIKVGGIAVHQYGDWEKLEKFGWKKGKVPESFKNQPDEEIWWPRNNQKMMSSLAKELGWQVISPDLGLVKRDSMIALQRER